MSRARELSKLGNLNVLSADDVSNEVGIASTVPRSTLDVRGELQVGTGIQVGPAGVITATSFDGALGGNIVALLLNVPSVIPFDWAFYGLAICSIVGISFGIYPAWRAANLDPIQSLRYD